MMVNERKATLSLKSCLSLLGDAGWFPELDAVLKKERGEKDRVGGEGSRGEGRGKGRKERKKREFPEV